MTVANFAWATGAEAQAPDPTSGSSAGAVVATPGESSLSLLAPPAAPLAPASAPPPLDPPPPAEPPKRPSFLRSEDEVRAAQANRPEREGRLIAAGSVEEPPPGPGNRSEAKPVPNDFVLNASPWVDFTLTSFWMNERVGNFLNLGAQFGGYFFDRLRISGRLVVPLEEVDDDYSIYDSYDPLPSGNGAYSPVDSPNVSVLYAGSVGVILSNTKSFVFAPSIVVQRTDVNDYGTSIALAMPFEWTTQRLMRVGFELAIGHAFGGTVLRPCYANGTSCGQDEIRRPGGSSFLLQYHMGWAVGAL